MNSFLSHRLFFISSLLLFGSCSKDPATPLQSNKNLIAIVVEETPNISLQHRLYYNATGTRVDSIITTGTRSEIRRFTYANSHLLIKTQETPQSRPYIDSIVYDTEGRPLVNYMVHSNGFIQKHFVYNATGQLESSITKNLSAPYNVTQREDYTWNNGDLTRVAHTDTNDKWVSFGNDFYSYNSDTSMPADRGNLMELLEFGNLKPKNAHMRVTESDDHVNDTFSYVITNGLIRFYTGSFNKNSSQGGVQKTTITYLSEE